MTAEMPADEVFYMAAAFTGIGPDQNPVRSLFLKSSGYSVAKTYQRRVIQREFPHLSAYAVSTE
jgi:hypothetical protein